MNLDGRRPLLIAAPALALAVLFAVLAVDVAAWRSSIANGDRNFDPAEPARSAVWEPDGALVPGLSRRLLGLDDDLAFRRAVTLFFRSRPDEEFARTLNDSVFATRAVVALRELQRSRSLPNERRAQAANLVGVLSLADALNDREQASALLRTSARSFTEAIRLDPGNAAASANLELALKLAGERRERFETEAAGGAGGGTRGGRRRGF